MKTKQAQAELARIIRKAYSNPVRGWHNLQHLRRMRPFLDDPIRLYPQWEAAILTAWMWHDFTYVPGAHVNESMSIQRMRKVYKSGPTLDMAEKLIRATEVNDKGYTLEVDALRVSDANYIDGLINMFRRADWCGLNRTDDMNTSDMELLADWESGVQHEYGPNNQKYREGRLRFLEWAVDHDMLCVQAADFVSHLVNRPTRVAIYAGSFLPYHIGHDDIYRKACKLFDHVIVSRGRNPEKSKLNAGDWTKYGGVNREYDGMLIDHIREVSAEIGAPVTLVRGLRDGFDLVKEFQMNEVLQDQARERGMKPLSIIYIHGDRNLNHVSGEVVRSLPENERRMYLPARWSCVDALNAFVEKYGEQEPCGLDIFEEA